MFVARSRLNGKRLREENEAKLASDERMGRRLEPCMGGGSRGRRSGGFDVTVEGVAISGPLETQGEITAAVNHDWKSADMDGEDTKTMAEDASPWPLDPLVPGRVGHRAGVRGAAARWHADP